MYKRIEVFYKDELPDPLGNAVRSEIAAFGFPGVTSVRVRQVYIIFGNVGKTIWIPLLKAPGRYDYPTLPDF